MKEQRKKLGLKQSEAAEKCGVSREIWGKWERGENKPTSEKLFSFEKIGIDVNYVMYGEQRSDFRQPEITLSAEEQELLTQFRQLNQDGKTAIFSMLSALLPKKVAEDNPIQRHYGT
ncbi:helix-turn-helix transcriptional regulator [Simonsiella muelleri]|uniref:helix-turn-helix domain-containing protein n=1 Tax=Simonsiella muelleri TaxID=72 RepID=UPI0028D0C710|nr:helix-turn-helix transcriptional regulator [Simonsiella muelleri]